MLVMTDKSKTDERAQKCQDVSKRCFGFSAFEHQAHLLDVGTNEGRKHQQVFKEQQITKTRRWNNNSIMPSKQRMRGKGNRVTHSPWRNKRASVYQNVFILWKTLSLWTQRKTYRKKSPLKETIFRLDAGRYISLICGYTSIRATLLIQQRGTRANISADISGWIITLAWVD